ncbi:MAG: hypothetical protein WAM97_20515 [Acidimicrobiales bacterium]
MQFSKELREDVVSGAISVSFRLWQSPRVKEGKRYVVGPAQIEIDRVDLVAFGSITKSDIRQSGEPDIDTLRARAAHSGPISDDTLVFRVEFHVVDDG